MGMIRSTLVWLTAVYGMGCTPAVMDAAPAAPLQVEAAPDTLGLVFLLPPDDSTPTSRAATETLRGAMTRAGYRIVTQARDHYDAEIVTRAAVSGGDIGVPSSASGRVVDMHERVHFTVTAVAERGIIDTFRTDFMVENSQVAAAAMVPTVNAIGRSAKLAMFAAKLRSERVGQTAGR